MAMTYDSALQGANEAKPPETAFDVVNVAFDRALLVSVRVQQLADRLCGSVPQAVSGGSGAAPSVSAVFPALKVSAEDALRKSEEALEAISRIERALP